MQNEKYTAIFIDYENVYYHLTNTYADIPELNDYVIELLRSLKAYLEKEHGLLTIIANAYADYERIKATPQSSLYLSGVETVYVLGTGHKNAADMRLCIDAMDVLSKRPEIETFEVFAGDRDYIPLIQHLKKQAKKVYAVGFAGSFSGDLLTNVGEGYFIDATKLFAPERLKKLEESTKKQKDYERAEAERDAERTTALRERENASDMAQEAQKRAFEEQSAHQVGAMPSEGVKGAVEPEKGENEVGEPVSVPDSADGRRVDKSGASTASKGEVFNIAISDLSEEERACLSLMVSQFGNYHEIFLSPFLRKLSDMLPNLADWQRKGLISDLEYKGAVRMEKRSGIPFDYTVVILNYNHPVVREMC